jgi:hypothetical protein
LQHFGASARKHAAPDLYSVVQLRMIQHLHHGPNRSSLGIVRAVNQALDAGMDQSSGTHCARFNCSKELAVGQSVITHGGTSITQRHNLSMCRRIAIADVAIPSSACDAPFAHHDCAHRHLARFQRTLGATQSFLHKKFIVLGRGCFLDFLPDTQLIVAVCDSIGFLSLREDLLFRARADTIPGIL